MPLIYSYDSSTQSYVVAEGSTAEGAVVVPSSYDDGVNGVADVKTIGLRAFANQGITSVSLPNTITVIDNHAFKQCSSLQSIAIPNSVLYINNSAFEYCSSLTTVEFQANSNLIHLGTYVFLHCWKLKAINLANCSNLIHLRAHTFWYCGELENITLPPNLETIGVWAFEYCYNLKNITLPNSLKSIGQKAFATTGLLSISIPNGVTALGPEAFASNQQLVSANIPSSIRNPGLSGGIFAGCYNLTSTIVFPEGITEIPGGILNGCRKVTNIILPSTLLRIGAGNNAFSDTGIVSITIPPSVTIIADWAFAYCKDLTTINLENVTVLGYGVFAFCAKLNNVTLNNQITGIRAAFIGCTSFTSITIPTSCTRIEGQSFSGCENLSTVVIPSNGSLYSIEDFAFYNCAKLTSINLPESLTQIGKSAFSGCRALTSINMPSALNTIGANPFAFAGLSSIEIPLNNLFYSSLDGVLYNKNKTTLIAYPSNKNQKVFSIPSSVNTIGESAFNGNTLLNKIIVPSSLTNVAGFGFAFLDNLTDLTFLGNPPSIAFNSFVASNKITVYYYSKNNSWSGDVFGLRPLRAKFSDLNILKFKNNALNLNKTLSNLSKVFSRKTQLNTLVGEIKTEIINKIRKKSNDKKKNVTAKEITRLSIEQTNKRDRKINDPKFVSIEWLVQSIQNPVKEVYIKDKKIFIETPWSPSSANTKLHIGYYSLTGSSYPINPMKVIEANDRKIFIISPFGKWFFDPDNKISSYASINFLDPVEQSVGFMAESLRPLVGVYNTWSDAQKEVWDLESENILGHSSVLASELSYLRAWKIFDAENNKLYINYNTKSSVSMVNGADSLAELFPVEGWSEVNLRKEQVGLSFKSYVLSVNSQGSSSGLISTTAVPYHNIYGDYYPVTDVNLTNPTYKFGGLVFRRDDPFNDNVYYIQKDPDFNFHEVIEVTNPSPNPSYEVMLPYALANYVAGDVIYIKILNKTDVSIVVGTTSGGIFLLDAKQIGYFRGQVNSPSNIIGWDRLTMSNADHVILPNTKWRLFASYPTTGRCSTCQVDADSVLLFESTGLALAPNTSNDVRPEVIFPGNISWIKKAYDNLSSITVSKQTRNIFFGEGSGGPLGSGWGIGISLI